MKSKLYCPNCCEIVDYKVIEREEDFRIRGESVRISAKVAVCVWCDSELFEPELEDENLLKAYRTYAQRHGLLTPEEIISIRESLGLSQEEFANLLGISTLSLSMYESGALIPQEISNAIKVFKDSWEAR